MIVWELLSPSSRHTPVQGIVLHAKVVSGEVTRRVAQVVVLVPQHPLTARGCRYNLHLDGELDCGEQLPAHLRLQQVREQGCIWSAAEPRLTRLKMRSTEAALTSFSAGDATVTMM